MDIYDKAKRSQLMASVRGCGNKSTELRMVSLFRMGGVRGWRRNYPLFGSPDFVFVKARVAIFVDGCYWHGCGRHFRVPTTNSEFWKNKIEGNVERDKLVSKTLRNRQWRVVRVWEHDLRSNALRVLTRVETALARGAGSKKTRIRSRRIVITGDM